MKGKGKCGKEMKIGKDTMEKNQCLFKKIWKNYLEITQKWKISSEDLIFRKEDSSEYIVSIFCEFPQQLKNNWEAIFKEITEENYPQVKEKNEFSVFKCTLRVSQD